MTTAVAAPVSRRAALARHRLLWPLVTLSILLAINAAFNPNFLHLEWRDGHLYGSLVDILNRAAPLMLVALGMTLVIATRGIDISVGAVVAISAALVAWMIGGKLVMTDGVATHVSRFPMSLAIVAALAVALLCGLWNGLLVARVGMQPIIATLILMVAGRGIAQLVTGGQIITIYYAPFFFIGNGHLLGLPFALYIAAAAFVLLHLATTRSALGLFIQAVGINPAAAHGAGVPARRITLWVYAFCGLCAGVAGLIVASNVKSADGNNAGQLLELDAILAVTLGGTYGIYSLGVPPEINLVVKAVVVFAVMLLQSAEFRRSVVQLARRAPAGAAP
jgi:simple sugar transport system permease protein